MIFSFQFFMSLTLINGLIAQFCEKYIILAQYWKGKLPDRGSMVLPSGLSD